MIDIKELSEQDLKQKIENIKVEREKTAAALKKYEEDLFYTAVCAHEPDSLCTSAKRHDLCHV